MTSKASLTGPPSPPSNFAQAARDRRGDGPFLAALSGVLVASSSSSKTDEGWSALVAALAEVDPPAWCPRAREGSTS